VANNSLTVFSTVNTNLFSYSFGTPVVNSNYGYTYPGFGIFSAKYTMHGSGIVTGANLLIGGSTTATGNTISAVVLNSAGAIVAQSGLYTILSTDLQTLKNFTFPVPPSFSNEIFYVGMLTTAGTAQHYPMGLTAEIPQRGATFYSFGAVGGTPSEFTYNYKMGIEVQVAPAVLVAHDAGTVSIDLARVITPGTVSPKATVRNFGANPESFNVTMTIGASYTSTKTVSSLASATSVQVTFDPWTNSVGDNTINVCTQLVGDLDGTNDCKTQGVKVMVLNKQVYGYVAYAGSGTDPVGPTTFNLSTPGILNSLANQSALQFVNGGTWANGLWYGSVYNTVAPYQLITLNPATGARTVIGDMGTYMNGLSYNPANNTLYGVDATSLYSIDMTNAETALIGTNTGSINMINLAINSTGQAFAVDVTSDVLGSVNLTTGIFTTIGPIGFNANYAQDMEFDRETGDLFMTAEDLSSGWLGWVNQATGAVLKIGDFEGGAEITGFAIPYQVAAPLAIDGTVTNVSCYGSASGAINTTTSGGTSPYGYLWSNGETTSSATALTAGAYTVTVTDANSLTTTGSWVVTQPTNLILSAFPTDATCPTATDGSIDLTVIGGTPGWSYVWSNSSISEDISGLLPGIYTVTVTDANNCQKTGSWTVGQLNFVCGNISVTGDVSSTVCYNASTAIVVAGGATTFTVIAPSGSATFISGSQINYLPGTWVQNGGYMWGKISTIYCSKSPAMPEVAASKEDVPFSLDLASFSLYPNPTNGNFTIVQKGDRNFGNVNVVVYSMRGDKVLTSQMIGEKKHEFGTSALPAGLYFVKVVADDYTETIKLIKTR